MPLYGIMLVIYISVIGKESEKVVRLAEAKIIIALFTHSNLLSFDRLNQFLIAFFIKLVYQK